MYFTSMVVMTGVSAPAIRVRTRRSRLVVSAAVLAIILASCAAAPASSVRSNHNRSTANTADPVLLFANDEGVQLWVEGRTRVVVPGPGVAAFADGRGGIVAQLELDGPLVRGVVGQDRLEIWQQPPAGSRWTLKGVAGVEDELMAYVARRDAPPERAATALHDKPGSELELGRVELGSGRWHGLLPLNAADGSVLRSVVVGDNAVARSTLVRGTGRRELDILAVSDATTRWGPRSCPPLPASCSVTVSGDGQTAAVLSGASATPSSSPARSSPAGSTVQLIDVPTGRQLAEFTELVGMPVAVGRAWVVLQRMTWDRPGDGQLNLVLNRVGAPEQVIAAWSVSWPRPTELVPISVTEVGSAAMPTGTWQTG
ncbi:MAG: hypothetical protein ACKV2O_10480 [Acidimicrobiales bacterium]